MGANGRGSFFFGFDTSFLPLLLANQPPGKGGKQAGGTAGDFQKSLSSLAFTGCPVLTLETSTCPPAKDLVTGPEPSWAPPPRSLPPLPAPSPYPPPPPPSLLWLHSQIPHLRKNKTELSFSELSTLWAPSPIAPKRTDSNSRSPWDRL